MKNNNLARKGKQNGMYGIHRIGELSPFYGKKHTKEANEKNRLTHLGTQIKLNCLICKKNFTIPQYRIKYNAKYCSRNCYTKYLKLFNPFKGKKHTQENLILMREKKKGKNHPNWKGGITNINQQIRNTFEFSKWRTSVFQRDNYTCVFCGIRGGVLNADHIKPFAHYPELRFEISNGRTLCVPCHKQTDTFAGRTKRKVIN